MVCLEQTTAGSLPAAKLAIQVEMVYMAAFCHTSDRSGLLHVVSQHHLLVVGIVSRRSVRTHR